MNTLADGHDVFTAANICIIIPVYNNGNTVGEVVSGVLRYTRNVIVVNDGSTDITPAVLQSFGDNIVLLAHQSNLGKGYALKTGFRKAIELGYKYAITLDSDGQHDYNELPLFLETLKSKGDAIIIGSRSFSGLVNMPSKNSFANRFSNFWFHLQTGLKLPDTQSGYRLYPLALFSQRKYFSRKYEFELEVIVRAAWDGYRIHSVPIDVFYPPKEDRVSHFRPIRDFARISVLNFFLTFLALAYFRPRQIVLKYKQKGIRSIIKENIITGNTSHQVLALSIGFGVFMGILPIWGYQLAVGFLLAHLFKMNKAIFFLAANISIPPFIPFILYLSYVTGGFILGDGGWTVDFDLTLVNLKSRLWQYVVGSVALAIMAGVSSGLLAYLSIPLFKKLKAR